MCSNTLRCRFGKEVVLAGPFQNITNFLSQEARAFYPLVELVEVVNSKKSSILFRTDEAWETPLSIVGSFEKSKVDLLFELLTILGYIGLSDMIRTLVIVWLGSG